MVLLQLMVAGVLGASAMIGVMYLIHWLKWSNADMLRAIGSIYTHSLANALGFGLLIHYCLGVGFAFLYALVIGNAPQIGPLGACVLGGILGLAHGLWIGLLLVILVAEHHPLEQFRKAGFEVALAHAAGHLFYGVTIGLTLALNWVPVQTAVRDFKLGAALGDFIGFTAVWIPLFGMPIVFGAYVLYLAHVATAARRRSKLRLGQYLFRS